MGMHHEHHGECCQPHEHHDQPGHDRLALPIGQLCCMGACNHIEHQQAFAHELQTHLAAESQEEDGDENSKDKKKRKRKALGIYGLSAVAV